MRIGPFSIETTITNATAPTGFVIFFAHLIYKGVPDCIAPGAGIDEMPKSQIEKRKRNMESTSRVSRREKRNVEICFLVREENENFCQKNGEILNIFSSFEMRREIQKYFL